MSREREIDALVAEHVFGATEDGWPEDWPMGTDDDGVCYPRLPAFSTEIGPAWEVLTHFDRYEVGWWGAFYASVESGGDDCGSDFVQGYAEANTAPMAICLAALKAKGVAVPSEGGTT